jgi:hypothetical protein
MYMGWDEERGNLGKTRVKGVGQGGMAVRCVLLSVSARDVRIVATARNSLRFCADFKQEIYSLSNYDLRECSVDYFLVMLL